MTKWKGFIRKIHKQKVTKRPCQEGGEGSHVARLNFETSHVGVYKCFRSLSKIEPKLFVFVGILEKGDSDVMRRNHIQFCNFSVNISTFRESNTHSSPFKINTIHSRIHWSSTDKRRSLKCKENWRKLLLLGIQTGDKLLPNHCSFLLIPSFAVTVAIWPRGVVSCHDFTLRPVATFLVMLLVGIYLGRASD